jgi:hypothetical protein
MKYLRLSIDVDGNLDLKLENGKFRWGKEGTQVANHAQIRLSTIKGELSLNGRLSNDETELDLYGIMLRADIGQAEKELEMKRVIMNTPGYQSLISFSYSQTAHTGSYSAQVQTAWGAITIGDTIEAL